LGLLSFRDCAFFIALEYPRGATGWTILNPAPEGQGIGGSKPRSETDAGIAIPGGVPRDGARIALVLLAGFENRARKITAASVDFIDDGGICVAQFVASRFFGRIGCFQEALLDPTLAQQRRGARLIAE
jgi:hypothetical protein